MSANYFGDLIRETTGETAGNHIRQYIQRAKNELAVASYKWLMAWDSNIRSTSAKCSGSRQE